MAPRMADSCGKSFAEGPLVSGYGTVAARADNSAKVINVKLVEHEQLAKSDLYNAR